MLFHEGHFIRTVLNNFWSCVVVKLNELCCGREYPADVLLVDRIEALLACNMLASQASWKILCRNGSAWKYLLYPQMPAESSLDKAWKSCRCSIFW